jgi:hypothetical protein
MKKIIFFTYWVYSIYIMSEIISLILFWIKVSNVEIPFLRYFVTIITGFSIIANSKFMLKQETDISKIIIINGSFAIIIIPLLVPIYQDFVIFILGFNVLRVVILVCYLIYYFANIIYLYFMKARRKITMSKNDVQVMSTDI